MKRSLLTLSLATAAALFARSAFPAVHTDESKLPSLASTKYALVQHHSTNGVSPEIRLFGSLRPVSPTDTMASVSGDRVTVSMTSLPLRMKVAQRLTSESGAFG